MALLVIVLGCVFAWWLWQRYRLLRLTDNVPTLPGALPIVGHAHMLLGSNRKMWDFFQNLQKRTMCEGGIMKIWIGPLLCFAVTDPKFANTALHSFEDKVYVYKFSESWIGEGIFTAEVAKWKRHRKLINPTFNQHLLYEFLEVFNDQSRRLVDRLSSELGKEEFDVTQYLETNFLEIVCRTAIGLSKTDTLKICNEEYSHAASKMMGIVAVRFQNIWMHPYNLYSWTKAKKEEDKVVGILKNMSAKVLRKRTAEFNENILNNNNNADNTSLEDTKKSGLTFKAFLDQLLELKAQGLLTDEEINNEVDTMIMAGSDTTARTMLLTLILLASHQDVQDRLYDEIQEVLGGTKRDVTKDDLSKFVYMEAVIKESLRYYPIAPVVARKVAKSSKIGDIFLPSGSAVIVFISALHQDKSWGEDTDKFRPERWLDGSLPEKITAFAAFSLGRRGCIGKHYAMMSMKTTLTHVIGKYRFSRKDVKLKMKCDAMLRPTKGHLLSIELR